MLEKFGEANLIGSYRYGVMMWKDITSMPELLAYLRTIGYGM